MSGLDDKETNKVTLNIELKELVDIVSKSKTAPISGSSSQHAIEAEELKKAWFKHVLISVEKLSDTVQEIRTKDLKEVKSEIKAELQKELTRVEDMIKKNEGLLEDYKRETIKPVTEKINTLVAKLSVWGLLAGVAGSGIMALLLLLIEKYLLHRGGL